MKSMLRLVSLVVVSFAAASAFSADVLPSTGHPVQTNNTTMQAAPPSGGTLRALVVSKCTNPRECSVGGA